MTEYNLVNTVTQVLIVAFSTKYSFCVLKLTYVLLCFVTTSFLDSNKNSETDWNQ